MVSLVTTPPIFGSGYSNFRQSLDLKSATVTVSATTAAGAKVAATVAVDANSNTVDVSLTSSVALSLEVVVQSLHPNHAFTYGGGFGGPGPLSGPDLFAPSSAEIGEKIVISHRNEDSDEPAAFNYTLQQQGLGHLVDELQASKPPSSASHSPSFSL